MFIAMNRFRVAKGSEAAFEHVWMSRDSHLDKVPGFVEFHLLKGPEAEDYTLYASHGLGKPRYSEAAHAVARASGSTQLRLTTDHSLARRLPYLGTLHLSEWVTDRRKD
jgi:hypothetical protein